MNTTTVWKCIDSTFIGCDFYYCNFQVEFVFIRSGWCSITINSMLSCSLWHNVILCCSIEQLRKFPTICKDICKQRAKSVHEIERMATAVQIANSR